MVPSPRPGVRGRALVVVLCFVVFVASRPSFAQTGDDWRISNIGAPVLAGSASIQCQSAAACAMNVTAAGADIGGISDQFTFAYFTFTGDGAFVARVDSLVNTDDAAAAGLMVRESLRPGSKHALALVSAVKTPAFQRRLATDGITLNTAGLQVPSRVWLKLERVGATFSAYQSADGATWTRYASDTIDMPATVLVGLAVTSHNPALRTTARFSRIGVTPLLPNEWQSSDVGPWVAGATFYSSGTFLLRAAGTDIWGKSDGFRYTFRQVSGDVDVIARVPAIQNISASTKAGLMIRAALSPSAANASVFGTPSKGVAFQRRPVAGGQTVSSDGGALSGPVWLKLERRDNRIASFRSSDGLSWSFIGEDTMTLSQDIYVGLALTSHIPQRTATATFDQVSVRKIHKNASPTVSLTAPASGTTVKPGASIALSATATDSDGSVVAVDFLVNGTLISSDSAAPYSATWTPMAAGTFTITAVARDNAGASATSNAATVTVQNLSPTISLTAPASGATATLGSAIALTATATDPDGSVAAVDFLVNGTLLGSVSAAPYRATWTPQAAGTFTITAIARDNGGASATSNAATVTVQAALPVPPAPSPLTLTFTPSVDDSSLVDFYQLEVFTTAETAGAAVLVQSLGKPVVSAGEISIDVTGVLAQLPAGSYVAIVDAVGAGGIGRSDPSPAFTR